MKRSRIEKLTVAVMFVLVMTIFSLANRDTQKLIQLHAPAVSAVPGPSEMSQILPAKNDTVSITVAVH